MNKFSGMALGLVFMGTVGVGTASAGTQNVDCIVLRDRSTETTLLAKNPDSCLAGREAIAKYVDSHFKLKSPTDEEPDFIVSKDGKVGITFEYKRVGSHQLLRLYVEPIRNITQMPDPATAKAAKNLMYGLILAFESTHPL